MPGSTRNRQFHGRTFHCTGGYRAFLPAPLPPAIGWEPPLAAALSRADLAVGRLAGEGSRFSNPHLFNRPFVRREAVLSSRNEGTQPDGRPHSAVFAACLRRFRLRFCPIPACSGPAAIPRHHAEPYVMNASNRHPRHRRPHRPPAQAGSWREADDRHFGGLPPVGRRCRQGTRSGSIKRQNLLVDLIAPDGLH